MTTVELRALIAEGKVKEHHKASRRGYVSRKSEGYVESYKGVFGTGYILVTPRFDTTRYVDITYFIA